jgi:hypothetical protein
MSKDYYQKITVCVPLKKYCDEIIIKGLLKITGDQSLLENYRLCQRYSTKNTKLGDEWYNILLKK